MGKLTDNYFYPLAESLLEGGDKKPHLPQCFCDADTMSAAWEAVFGSRDKLEKAADKLRKLRINTCITRKDLRHGAPELVLTAALGLIDLRTQLRGQLPEDQAFRLTPGYLVGLYTQDLLGKERAAHYSAILDLKHDHEIQAQIVQRLPKAKELFSFGWNEPTIYAQLLMLPDLLSIIETERGPRFYQAALAAHSCIAGLMHTSLPLSLMDGSHPVAAAQLVGAMSHWAFATKLRQDNNMPTISSAAMLQGHMALALERARNGVYGGAFVLHELSFLYSMWSEHTCAFPIAVTEYLDHMLIPGLVRYSKKIESVLASFGRQSAEIKHRPIAPSPLARAAFPPPRMV